MEHDANLALLNSSVIDDAPFSDYFKGIAVDSLGNVYVGGENFEGGSSHWLVLKFGPHLTGPSRQAHSSPSGFSQFDIVADTNNVFSAGYTWESDPAQAVLVKFGGNDYVRTFATPDPGFNAFMSMVTDGQGNVYADEYSQTYAPDFYAHHRVLKYGPDGSQIWSIVLISAAGQNSMSEGKKISLDSQNNIYVAGAEITQDGDPRNSSTVPSQADAKRLHGAPQ
jgi:hypothetical protein